MSRPHILRFALAIGLLGTLVGAAAVAHIRFAPTGGAQLGIEYVAVAAIFIALETVVPLVAEQGRARSGWNTDLAFMLGNTVLFAIGLGFVIGSLGAVVHRAMPTAVTAFVTAMPLWLQSVVAIALGDLGVYAAHRLEHATPVLWRFHSVHHAAEEMDFLVAVRNHPVDLFVQRAGALLPLIALGITPAALGIYALVYFWQAFLVHANVRMNYGPLRWVLVSPDFHHWHHAEQREAYDRNFAGLCAFGT